MAESILDTAVGYWRMSSSPQEKSIPQQRAEMLPRCKLEGVELAAEFKDEGKSGGGMRKRDSFLEMLRYCQEQHKQGKPVGAIVCYGSSRFSRADSNETSAYIWEFRQAGVNRLLTFERWYDFRKEEDRAIFNIQQDFTSNRYLRDLSARVLRGKKAAAAAGFFTGGQVPYGFDRLLLDEKGEEVARIKRGEKVRLRKQGWKEVLAPIPEDDPDDGRQLERQTAIWLYETFDAHNVSFRWLAEQLNAKGVPGAGTHYNRRKPDKGKWTIRSIQAILTRPVYAGTARMGDAGSGAYHRLVDGEIKAVEPGTSRTAGLANPILTPMEYGGLVGRDLWERVQAKAAARSRDCPLSGRKRTLARTSAYVIPSGILHCGHCGGRMYGCTMRPERSDGTRRCYRKYSCGTPNVKPGTCRAYTVDEDLILDELVNQLLTDYTDPARLEALRQKLHNRTKARQERAPAEVERLRKRLAEKDEEIRDAARNVLKAKENADVLNEALSELRRERQRLAKQLEAAERVQAEAEEDAGQKPDDAVEAGIASLFDLREQLLAAKANGQREKLGELIQAKVSRVDLYFEPEQKKKRTLYRFVKGAIKLRPVLNLQGCDTSSKLSDNDTRQRGL
jgi:DNA invertase Pin-like site-specific DNA recombinase